MNNKLLIIIQSLRIRTGFAFAIGVASPLVMKLLFSIDPLAGFQPTERWVIFPGVFLILSLILILALATLLPRNQYRFQQSMWTQTLGVIILFALALWGSTWCFRNHVCVAGHGCHGMTSVGRVVDVLWVLGLIVSVFWGALARSPICIPSAYIGGFLVSYRFIFGSMGGLYPIPI